MTTVRGSRPRVLLVTVEFRVPPRSGRERRYTQHVEALLGCSDVGVLLLNRRGDGAAVPPPPGLTWWRDTPVRWLEDAVQWMRRSDGHPSYGQAPPEALGALDESLREFDPDVVVVGGLWLHGHLDRLRGRGRHIVLDAADVEGPLHEETARASPPSERLLRQVLARHIGAIEGHAVAAVDQIWACSEHDARALAARYPNAAAVMVVPNTVDAAPLRRPADAERPAAPGVVYPATFGYPPNDAAAVTLIREIHPLVRARFSTATLSLVGGGANARWREVASQTPGVTVTGPVADTRPWLWRSTALAAPLRAGSGTRIKLLEAFAAGLPVVTTAKGAEGLEVVDGEHALVAESSDQFADALMSLHQDVDAASALAARARRLADTRYSTAVAHQAIESALAHLPTRTT